MFLRTIKLTLSVVACMLLLPVAASGASAPKHKLIVEVPQCSVLVSSISDELRKHGWKHTKLNTSPGILQAIWSLRDSRISVVVSFERVYAPPGWRVVGSRDCFMGPPETGISNIFTVMEFPR